MHRLSDPTDFDASAYPELSEIFRTLDAGIAAIVAAETHLRPGRAATRRKRSGASGAKPSRPRQSRRRAA